MHFSHSFKTALFSIDEKLASISLSLKRDQGCLLSFVVHSLFESEAEANCGLLDPQQAFTVTMLRELLGHFTAAGYLFLSPVELNRRLCPSGKYALLTFDDGYYNNLRALPVLEEFGVPAVFFISTDHVKYGKAFWWDVLYRESRKRGRTAEEASRMLVEYKQLKTSQIESEISAQFGKSAMRTVSDLDRPFTAGELKKFAVHPFVFLGNHTRDHAILTNYSSTDIREQISSCQEALREITGKTPEVIAYPNGNCSSEILATAREAGLSFGLLACAGRNRVPLEPGSAEAMAMKRFALWGDRSVEAQCRSSRSRISIHRLLQTIRGIPAPQLPGNMRSGQEKLVPLSELATKPSADLR